MHDDSKAQANSKRTMIMDEITKAIREQYEDFPYPAGSPMLRAGTNARLLLSLGEKSRSTTKPIKVLDAGCGRGVGLLGCASMQPDVEFLGIDINRVGLNEINQQIQARGLTNLKVQEVNLMTLEGLEVPEGGFDVIYSSGVLHHLSDPAEGLKQLRSVLAPHGVISMMVYATYGRQPLYRLIRATELLSESENSLRDRIDPARELAEFCSETILKETPWDFVPTTNDTEFVDLCLNPNETSYSVETMWQLLSDAELEFLEWSIPAQWSVEVLPEGPLREQAKTLNEVDRYKLVEQITWQKSLELVIGHKDNNKRAAFDTKEVNKTLFAVNPDISFNVESRNYREGKRMESITFKRPGSEEPIVCLNVAQVKALTIFCDQFQPFTGDSFIDIMKSEGISEKEALKALSYCLSQEVLYRPHNCDF